MSSQWQESFARNKSTQYVFARKNPISVKPSFLFTDSIMSKVLMSVTILKKVTNIIFFLMIMLNLSTKYFLVKLFKEQKCIYNF